MNWYWNRLNRITCLWIKIELRRIESNRIIKFVSVPSPSLCHICCYEGPMYSLQWKAIPARPVSAVCRLIDRWTVRDRESSHYPTIKLYRSACDQNTEHHNNDGPLSAGVCCNGRTAPLHWYLDCVIKLSLNLNSATC